VKTYEHRRLHAPEAIIFHPQCAVSLSRSGLAQQTRAKQSHDRGQQNQRDHQPAEPLPSLGPALIVAVLAGL
jgi:hypothetical protein